MLSLVFIVMLLFWMLHHCILRPLSNSICSASTRRLSEIKMARIAVKHGDTASAASLLGGALGPYLGSKKSSQHSRMPLKIAINSVYGLTAAKFDNPFRDPRNVDNIVAKRGALFMVDLKEAVQERGLTVAHI